MCVCVCVCARGNGVYLAGLVDNVLGVHIRVDGVRTECGLLYLRQSPYFVPFVRTELLLQELSNVLYEKSVHFDMLG